MKLLSILLISSVATAGGVKSTQHDMDFERYVTKFHTAARLYASDKKNYSASALNKIVFEYGTKTESDEVARCQSGDAGMKVIVDRTSWAILSELEREVVIFHELGHCIIGRDHSEEMTMRGTRMVKKSLMCSVMSDIDSLTYSEFKTEYYRELFSPLAPKKIMLPIFPQGEIPSPSYEMIEVESGE